MATGEINETKETLVGSTTGDKIVGRVQSCRAGNALPG